MSDTHTRIFEDAIVEVAGVASKPMTVEVNVTTTATERSGEGEVILPEEVFAKLEEVNGQAMVMTTAGGQFDIMVRKAYKQTGRVEFETSGPVPEAS